MTSVLEEVHRATMQHERAAATFAPLFRPGERFGVVVWDGWPVTIQKSENHFIQKGTYTPKHHGNSFNRIEAVDLEGRPVFAMLLAASTSPRATDEAICYFHLDMEARTGMQGGLTAMLVGLPGYPLVHLFDLGFRYTISSYTTLLC